jgi:hypothetical protein
VEKGTIKIKTGFLFFQFLLYFFKTVISIDGGEPQKLSWGESTHSVDPGQHTVNVHVAYMLGWKVGKASTTVTVGANETVSLKYRVPILVYLSGSLKEVPA